MKITLIKLSFIGVILLFLTSSCKDNVVVKDDNFDKVNYTELDSVFINPERGFYSQETYYASSSTVLSSSLVKTYRTLGRSLILTMYYLDTFKDTLISDKFLQRFETNLKALRAGGSKCILRFAYTASESDEVWDAPQDLVLQQIQQLAPYLTEYSDVIYVMQAGFVGVWGEWYYTTNFIMNPSSDSDYAPRRAVLDALLQALPKDRMIAVRTPEFKIKCFGLNEADTLTTATAYSESYLSRIAAHNDCFLASSNDVGTYTSTTQRTFWQADIRYTSMGGETCGVSDYSSCENALIQMENYHWSYLNYGYHPSVLSDWRTNGCIDEINERLGYRFVLTEGDFSKNPTAGTDFSIQLKIKNTGFAALVNPRKVEIIFKSDTDSTDVYKETLDTDPRYWYAGGEYEIDCTYNLPASMSGKKYHIYLNLPDMAETLYDRPEYSIRLANVNMWDETTGYNEIYSMTVQ